MIAASQVRLLLVIAFGVFLIAVHVGLGMLPDDERPADGRPLHPNVGVRR